MTTMVRAVALVSAVTLIGLGCARPDARLEQLSAGISKDSVQMIMGGAPEQPTQYLVEGQFIEAMIYRRMGEEGVYDSLERRQLSPVVLVNGTVSGWGWDHWDSVATRYSIEVVPARK